MLSCSLWTCEQVHFSSCVHVPVHVRYPNASPPQSSALPYEIYSKRTLWESTHALPSLPTAPWQLLLYIPLQMRAMNQSDYRVEQEQRRSWGETKKQGEARESGRQGKEGQLAVQLKVTEGSCKLDCAFFINYSALHKQNFTWIPLF